MISDGALIFLSYFMAVIFRFDFLWDQKVTMETAGGTPFALVAGIYSVLIVMVYAMMRMYGSYRFKKESKEIVYILCINGAGTLVLLSLLFLFKLDFSRLTMLSFWCFSSVLVIVKRMIARGIMRHFEVGGYRRHVLLLVGGGELAERYYDTVIKNGGYGYEFKGYLADEPSEHIESYLGGLDKFRDLLAAGGVDEVVIATKRLEQEKVGSMIAACGRYSAKVSVIPAYNDFIPSLPHVEQAGTLKLVNVRSTPDKGLAWKIIKRSMDVVGSLLGLILTSPIMLGVAIAVKRCDGGPALFSQTRVGKNGKEFKMYKFRSMYIDAEQRLAELQKFNEVDGPAFKMENDPRITKVGKFIRRTSLDELPQLWNVLKGDMSIVGPRPPLPREVVQYNDWDWGRLAVKPGLTCYWQVSGRSDVSFDEWMKLDLQYVEEQGFWTDVKVIFKTVGVVVLGKGAY